MCTQGWGGETILIKMGSIGISVIFSVGGRKWKWASAVPAALILKVMSSDFSSSRVIWNNLKYIFGDDC